MNIRPTVKVNYILYAQNNGKIILILPSKEFENWTKNTKDKGKYENSQKKPAKRQSDRQRCFIAGYNAVMNML